MNTTDVTTVSADAQLERLKTVGEKYNVSPFGLFLAIAAIERAISQLPEELVSEETLSFALATHIARRIGHNSHRPLIDEVVEVSLQNIVEFKTQQAKLQS